MALIQAKTGACQRPGQITSHVASLRNHYSNKGTSTRLPPHYWYESNPTDLLRKILPQIGKLVLVTQVDGQEPEPAQLFDDIDSLIAEAQRINMLGRNVFVCLVSVLSTETGMQGHAVRALQAVLNKTDYGSMRCVYKALSRFEEAGYTPLAVVPTCESITAFWRFDTDLSVAEWTVESQRFEDFARKFGLKDGVVNDPRRCFVAPGSVVYAAMGQGRVAARMLGHEHVLVMSESGETT